MSIRDFFKLAKPSRVEAVEQELAATRDEITKLRQAFVEGTAPDDAIDQTVRLETKERLLAERLIKARQDDQRDADKAAAEEQDRLAELDRERRQSEYQGAGKALGSFEKAFAPADALIDRLVDAATAARKHARTFNLKMPDGRLPDDEAWADFDPENSSAIWVLDAFLLAMLKAGFDFPFVDRTVVDQPLINRVASNRAALSDFSKRVIVDGERYVAPEPEPPPEPPAPRLKPRYWLAHGRRIPGMVVDPDRGMAVSPNSIIREHQINRGRAESVYDRLTPGWSRYPTLKELEADTVLGPDAEAMVWIDHRGNVLGPAAPQAKPIAERLTATAQRLGIPLERLIGGRVETPALGAEDVPIERAQLGAVSQQEPVEPELEPVGPVEPEPVIENVGAAETAPARPYWETNAAAAEMRRASTDIEAPRAATGSHAPPHRRDFRFARPELAAAVLGDNNAHPDVATAVPADPLFRPVGEGDPAHDAVATPDTQEQPQ